MDFLTELFLKLDAQEIAWYEERLAVVAHKIQYMDKVPVICLNAEGQAHIILNEEIILAGGIPVMDPFEAAYIIFYQQNKVLSQLMAEVPMQLNDNWPAVKHKNIILLNDDSNKVRNAQNAVDLIEDIAEMLHPGHFIFGGEGNKWIRFM